MDGKDDEEDNLEEWFLEKQRSKRRKRYLGPDANEPVRKRSGNQQPVEVGILSTNHHKIFITVHQNYLDFSIIHYCADMLCCGI